MEKHANQNLASNLGKLVMYQIFNTLNHFFKDEVIGLSNLPDPREKYHYGIDEIAMSGISMFLFKEGSRNAYNNERKDLTFRLNYSKIFGMGLAHMDSVKDVFCDMYPSALEQYKANMIAGLIRKKALSAYRFEGKYKILVDGTGVASFNKPHCKHCLHKTYNKGKNNEKTIYFHNVLEAKLVAESGLCLSIASEWIVNEDNSQYNKQDCKREAFKRLAKKIKKYYPWLPLIIIADGLYPYQGFFDICQKNHGYNLGHKYVRCNFNALKNFYQCLQIAHIINQLVVLSQAVNQPLSNDKKLSVKYLWKRLLSFMLEVDICKDEITGWLQNRFQIRLC